MRLFIAISLSPEMKDALNQVQRQMKAQHVSGNYTPVENMHLTLAFIGEYPDPDAVRLPPVKPFEIVLDGFGCFGELWWAGLRPCPPLDRCVAALRRGLAGDGIPFDRKRFSPHITLLRRGVGRPAVQVPRVGMTVDHVSLMRSDRGRHGMIYTELRQSPPFGGGPDADSYE